MGFREEGFFMPGTMPEGFLARKAGADTEWGADMGNSFANTAHQAPTVLYSPPDQAI